MLKLIKPNKKYFSQYKDMMDEWNMEGSRIAPWPLHLKYHTEELFEEMLNRVQEVEEGNNLGEFASSTTYWLYDDGNNKLIGASNLRHYLTEEGLKLWGHIGYGIRPTERKKGLATKLLKLTMQEAKKMNIDKVLLGAYVGNIGSWKVIEKCGGQFEKIIIEDETGLPVKRYWINIK
jgi:acetyltransferase, GNAT family